MTLKEIDFELIFQSKILFFPVLSIKIPICCKNEWSLIDFVSSSLELGTKSFAINLDNSDLEESFDYRS